jgi:hypothetical protein
VQLELLLIWRWKFSQDSLAEVRAGTIVSGARLGAGTWKEWDCGLVGQLHKTVPRLANENIHLLEALCGSVPFSCRLTDPDRQCIFLHLQ